MEEDEHDELSEMVSSSESDGGQGSEEFEMGSRSVTSEESRQDDLPPDLVSTSEDETTDESGEEEETGVDADSGETDRDYKYSRLCMSNSN